MTSSEATRYEYVFGVWPHEGGWEKPVFDLFRMFPLVGMEFTEAEWGQFRAAIERNGLTLREISRVPYHKPETVL